MRVALIKIIGIAFTSLVTALLGHHALAQEEPKVLNVYNWADYLPDDLLANFQKETGIKVRYDTFDTNEVVHAKLVAGRTGYDKIGRASCRERV